MSDYVQEAIDIAHDDKHGYSQVHRNGDPDYDCSSLVIHCLDKCGYPVSAYGATYTGDLGQALKRAGFRKVKVNLDNADELQYGDILLNPDKHVEIYSGKHTTVGAHSSETGGIDGKPGDQTGNEISVQTYRNKGYTEVWRHPDFIQKETGRDYWDIVRDIISGKYGNGEDRITNLKNKGYSMKQIDILQRGVNLWYEYYTVT